MLSKPENRGGGGGVKITPYINQNWKKKEKNSAPMSYHGGDLDIPVYVKHF